MSQLSEFIYLNDKISLTSKTKISINNFGFLYGFGVYETILVLIKKPIFLDQHIDRLNAGLAFLGIKKNNFCFHFLNSQIIQLIKKNNLFNAKIRITVSPTCFKLDDLIISNFKITKVISASSLTNNYYERKIKLYRLKISSYIRTNNKSVPTHLKLSSCSNQVFAFIEARKNGFDDAVMLNSEGYITEGSFFNIFFIKKKIIYTPSVKIGILPGITRFYLLKICKINNLKYFEGLYKVNDLYEADEIFITSSIRGILPVIQINEYFTKSIEYTKKIIKLYHDFLKQIVES